jgi:hypothetical protein
MVIASLTTPVIWALLGLVVGYLLGHKRRFEFSFQNSGEEMVSRTIKSNFKAPDYHLCNHITLPHKGGTTQVDHILVSRFGVFVIETKDYSGWIFGNAKHDFWTQVKFNIKYKFQNPIRQNYRHVQAVQELLDFLPSTSVQSLVVFVGNAEFKTEMPDGVFALESFIAHVKNCSEEVMSMNRLQFSIGRIEATRLAISGETDLEHVQALRRRYGQRD